MPKVVEKGSSDISLLLRKKPAARQSPPRKEFGDVLKEAGPKPKAPPAAKIKVERPACADKPKDTEPTDEAAVTPEPTPAPTPDDKTALPIENQAETPDASEAPDGPVPAKHEPKTADDTNLAELVLQTQVAEVPPQPLEAQHQEADVSAVEDVPPVETDQPAEPEAKLAAAKITPVNLGKDKPEAVAKEQAPQEIDPDLQPIAPEQDLDQLPVEPVAKQLVPRTNVPDQEVPSPDAVPAAASRAPAAPDAPKAETDDAAENVDVPKLKQVKPREKDGTTDDKGADQQQQQPPAATAHDKAAPPAPDASSPVDSTAVKAPAPATHTATATAIPLPPPVRTEEDFAATNHERIVTSIRSQLLPNGGTMRIRLDPPEMGQMQIVVRMADGVMQASFETTSDQATRLLSHSLSHLKTALESQGVSVDKLQVQQSPRDQQSPSSSDDQQRNSQNPDSQAQREQQRRELLNRMWRRLRLGSDPLDMVA